MAQLLAIIIAALICMATGWWLGYRSRQPDTLVVEPWPDDPPATPVPESTSELEAVRIAAANARHGLKEASEEAERLRREVEQLRARADDREAKLRVAERMLVAAQEARITAVDAQIAAEEKLSSQRLIATARVNQAQSELEGWRATAEAHGRALTAAQGELSRLREQVAALEARQSAESVPAPSLVAEHNQLRARFDELQAEREAWVRATEEERGRLEAERDALHADLASALLELEELRQHLYGKELRRVAIG